LAGEGAGAGFGGEAAGGVEGDTADGDLEVFRQLVFDGGVAAPVGEGEAAVDFRFVGVLGREVGVDVVLGVELLGIFRAEGAGAFEERILNVVEGGHDRGDEFAAGGGSAVLGALVAATPEDAILVHVARADFDEEGDAFLDPLPDFVAAAEVAGVHFDFEGLVVIADGAQFGTEFLAVFQNFGARLFFVHDGEDDDLRGRELGRKDEAVVVAMGHDDATDKTRGDAPRGGPGEFLLAGLVEEFNARSLGEILAEEVGSAGLQCLAILHHGFDAISIDGARETFAGGFFALDDGHGKMVLGEVGIDAEHLAGFFHRFGLGGVGGVTLLPEELGGAEEKTRAHFPADDVSPLVDENRQVAIALNPLGIHFADDRFGSGVDNEGLVERRRGAELAVGAGFEAGVGDYGAFLGKALDVGGFLFQKAHRDEEREVGVDVAGVLEALVEGALHVFPERVAPGLDDHATADGAVLGEVGGLDDLLVPLRIIIHAGGRDGGFELGGRRIGGLGHKCRS